MIESQDPRTLPDPATWSLIRVVLHVAFLLAVGYLLQLIADVRSFTELRHLTKPKGAFRAPMIALTLLFAVLLIYQASWQLTGVLRPDFIAFMQLHDRREFNPAHRIQRGRILDRRGETLAYSEEILGQVYRLYPDGPTFAHVVGYSQPRFGATGLEAVATVHLNGGSPSNLIEWGRLGRQVVTQDKRPRGQDLALTLDAELQRLAVKLLDGRHGAVVLLQPNDGAIRVLASVPAFDPNRVDAALFQGQDPNAPLLDRATQGLYPPGSTFKIVMAALAIERGFRGTLDCPAEGFSTSSRYPKIRDHEYYSARKHGNVWKGHGPLGLSDALAKSSNVFFAQLGASYGHDAFYAMAHRMHFDRPIVLHQSPYGRWTMQTGRLPKLNTADRYGLAQMSVGQGRLLVTPAQMALIAAAVANRGIAMRPRLIQDAPPVALARFMSTDTADRLVPMLRAVVTEGTARGIDDPKLAIAGKTGTAQQSHGASHSWFVGFAPAEHPALAIAVLVEGGGYGSVTAAPIAQAILLRAQTLGMMP